MTKSAASTTARSGRKKKKKKSRKRKQTTAPIAHDSSSSDPYNSKRRSARASLQHERQYVNVDSNHDVILGQQGNDHPGMKHFCYLLQAFGGHNIHDSNAMDRAEQVMANIGRGRLVRRDTKSNKFYELPKDEALKLIVKSFGRKHIVDFDENKDIVAGRGSLANENPANKDYRDRIDARKIEYQRATRPEKKNISREIVGSILAEGGRFLTDENSTKHAFYEMSFQDAVDKTSQALRTKAK